MNGLKRVRERHADALTQVDWRQLEVLLAVYYRGQGYHVEHVGTGATGARSDGGIDLKLRRNEEYVLVQVKHWNAYQVPHNDVHQLLGLMVNEGATGAILITSGEFTKAAIEAATRQGHVQLIDGGELRVLLGPLPVSVEPRTPMVSPGDSARRGRAMPADSRRTDAYETAHAFARTAAERLIDTAEDRIRNGHGRHAPGRSAPVTGLDVVLFKLATTVLMVGLVWLAVRFALNALQTALSPAQAPVQAAVRANLPEPTGTPHLLSETGSSTAPMDAEPAPPREPTAAEIRESQRKADEAMRVIEATTPEM